MLFFLIDTLIIAWFVAVRWGEPEVCPGEHPAAANPQSDTGATTLQLPPTPPGRPSPQRGTISPALERSKSANGRAGEPTSSELPVWTTLDEHQLTRLLKQSSS